MKTLSVTLPTVLLAGALVVIALIALFPHTPMIEASTARGSEYQGTTTSTGRFPAEAQLLSTNGTLGSVTITGAAAGVIELYDATTSDITKRAASMSSSTMLLASFPVSAAAGTYTFDRITVNGLYVVLTGTMPTSTITFRQ